MLAALVLITAGLLALGPFLLLLPRLAHPLGHWGTTALCGTGLALSLAELVAGAEGTLALPIGLPGADGGGMRLAFDGLTGFALPPLFLCGTASAACVPGEQGPGAALPPLFVGCMALALLAADGFTLLLGVEGMSLAIWGLLLVGAQRDGVRAAARSQIGAALFGGACLIPAMGLLGVPPSGFGLSFADVRAAPPEDWRAATVLGLTLLGAGSRMGLAPWHAWMPPAHAAVPGHLGALLSGAATGVAAYVLVRILFDLCGPATPAWWGVPLLAFGAASAVLGALRANTEPDLAGALAAGTASSLGLAVMGVGVALAARGSDLTPLASLALGGVLLHLLAHATSKTLLLLCAGSVEHAAGSYRLSRLGGLIHRMPVTALCALVGAVSFAVLPPGAGFAGAWMVLQALLAAPRVGGPVWQITAAVAVVAAGMSVALAASAAVRLVGLAFLGRPRTPGAAAAREAPRRIHLVTVALAGLLVLLGLLPGPALRLADPALRSLVGAEPEGVGGLLVAPDVDAPGYSAPGLAALLAVAGLIATRAVRARMAQGERRGPAWDGGLGTPPAASLADDPAAWASPSAIPFGITPRLSRPPRDGFRQWDLQTRVTQVGLGASDPARTRTHRRSHPLARRARLWLAQAVSRAHRPTPGQALAVTLSALALLLALAARAGGR